MMFNIHFSVLANLGTQFCFDDYIISFNFCAALLSVILRGIWKPFEISPARLYKILKSLSWKSLLASALQKFNFSCNFLFFWKKMKHLYPINLNILYCTSVSLCCSYSFLYIFLFIHSEESIDVLDKRFEFLGVSVHKRFEKIGDLKIWKLLSKSSIL